MYVCMKIHVNMPTNISPLGYMICKNPKLADLGFQNYETADLCYTLTFFFIVPRSFIHTQWKVWMFSLRCLDLPFQWLSEGGTLVDQITLLTSGLITWTLLEPEGGSAKIKKLPPLGGTLSLRHLYVTGSLLLVCKRRLEEDDSLLDKSYRLFLKKKN